MSIFERLSSDLESERECQRLRRSSVIHCRALLEDSNQVYANGLEHHQLLDQPSTLRNLSLNTLIQGTTLSQFKSIIQTQFMPGVLIKELFALALAFQKSPIVITKLLQKWPDKEFKLLDVYMNSKNRTIGINSMTSLIYKEQCEDTLDFLAVYLLQIFDALSSLENWGPDCRIETIDLSGLPISTANVRKLGILSKTQIAKNSPQITRTVIVDLSLEIVDIDRVLIMLKRPNRSKTKGPCLIKVCVSKLSFFAPFKDKSLQEFWPLFSPLHLKGLSLRYAYLTNDNLTEDFPGLSRFENLTSLDLSSSTIDLSRRQRHSANRQNQMSLAVDSINYVVKNLTKLRRLDLSDCVLTGQLQNLFQDVCLPFTYLSFSGCRLLPKDIRYLSENSDNFTSCLVELNLSHNLLHRAMQQLKSLFEKCRKLRIVDLESVDFENSDMEPLVESLTSHMPDLRCLNLSEEMSRNNLWTPDVVKKDILVPLLMGSPSLEFLFLPHREEFYQHTQDFFTTCPLSENFIQMVNSVQDRRVNKGWHRVKIDWKCKVTLGTFFE